MTSIALQFEKQPPLLKAILAALFTRRSGFAVGAALPNIKASWCGAQVDQANLKNYLNLCQLSDDGYLPILYPHVMASTLHLNMLTDRQFPIKLLGAVHLRSHILSRRKINRDETVDIQTEIVTHRVVAKGLEFDFTTTVTSDKETIWESITTYYVQGRFGEEDAPSLRGSFTPLENPPESAQWFLDKQMARRYARITGDYNPIHISFLLAKLFGFKRDLLHAFCALATSIRHLPTVSDNEAIRIDVAFKGPLYLKNTVYLKSITNNDAHRFDLYCGTNDRPCIVGNIKLVPEDSTLV